MRMADRTHYYMDPEKTECDGVCQRYDEANNNLFICPLGKCNQDLTIGDSDDVTSVEIKCTKLKEDLTNE